MTHGGVMPEWSGSALGMRIVSLPRPEGASERAAEALRMRLLAATIRLTTKNHARVWTAEIVFHGSPVRTPNPKEQGPYLNSQCDFFILLLRDYDFNFFLRLINTYKCLLC